MKRVREAEEAVRQELVSWPGAELISAEQNKHIKLYIETPNGVIHFVISSSPSCWRTSRNMVRDLRRALRNRGLARN